MPIPELLAWYDRCARSLPFRGTRDPYRVWLSEIMLQQTRTETAGGYYLRFLERFPTVTALAAAEEQEVLKCWEGLGYYSRARNLHKAAKVVADEYGGVFPADPDKLLALPGVGGYTASAIASIAFSLPCPAMDGNLTRVLARLHGVREDVGMPSVKRRLYTLALADIDRERPGDFNQALMDLGAGVCVPGTPDCARCPLAHRCDAHSAGDADMLPVRAAAKPPKPVDVGVALVTRGNRVLMTRRKDALLRGMWVFMLSEGRATPEDMQKRLQSLGVRADLAGELAAARHIFTHRVWNMRIFHYISNEEIAPPDARWVDADGVRALPLPTAMRKAKALALALLEGV